VAAALDEVGSLLGTESFGPTRRLFGPARLVDRFGPVGKVGVEGTGAYGAGLARFLARAGIEVIKIDRQNRQDRRRQGQSDPSTPSKPPGPRCQDGPVARQVRDGAVEAIRSWWWPSVRPARPG